VFHVPRVQFAVADDSNYTFSGVLGLGYAYPHTINYPSVLNLMVSNDMIMAPIFSVGLGGDQDNFSKPAYGRTMVIQLSHRSLADNDIPSGEIIFGGVNRWKFAGKLEPVAIWPPIKQQDPRWLQ
jgi:hypothetical protein